MTVAIPCHNEAAAVSKVVRGFAASLPDARVVVFDNASTDATSEAACSCGADVRTVGELGKGNAVRAAFGALDSDVIVLIDGDGTYDPADAEAVVGPVLRGEADMVVGERMTLASPRAFLPWRSAGNRIITFAVGRLYGRRFIDTLSGYRAVSRDLLDRIDLHSTGFEIEVELLAEALKAGARIVEVPVRYDARHEGSRSKLLPIRDALRILATAVRRRPRGPVRVSPRR